MFCWATSTQAPKGTAAATTSSPGGFYKLQLPWRVSFTVLNCMMLRLTMFSIPCFKCRRLLMLRCRLCHARQRCSRSQHESQAAVQSVQLQPGVGHAEHPHMLVASQVLGASSCALSWALACCSQHGGVRVERQHSGDGVAGASGGPRLQPLGQPEQHHHRRRLSVVPNRNSACRGSSHVCDILSQPEA
jgi:hypothetical protein